MDIFIFLPLIIFLFFVFVIRKIFKQALSSKKSTVKDSPWKQILGDLATQIKQEMEASKKARDRADPERKTQRKLSLFKKQPLRPKALQKDALDLEKRPSLSKRTSRKKPPLIRPAKPLPEAAPSPTPEISQPKKFTRKIKIRELKKAVVWSEILAPPLALRKRDQ